MEKVFNLKTFKSMNNQRIVVSVNPKRTIKIMKLTVHLPQRVADQYKGNNNSEYDPDDIQL